MSRLHAGPTNTMTSALKWQLLASLLRGKTRRSTLPRARRRDPRYVIALIDPVAYDRQTVLAETAGAVVGVAERERHPAVGAGATHRLVAGQGAERYALVLGLRERATVMRGALLRQRDRLALPQVRAGPSILVVAAPHASRRGGSSAVRFILKVLTSPRGVPALGLDGVPLTESRRYAEWPGVGRLARGRSPRVAHVVGLVPVALCRDAASLRRRQSPALHLTLPAPVLATVRGVAHGGVGHPRAPVPSSHRVFPSLDSPEDSHGCRRCRGWCVRVARESRLRCRGGGCGERPLLADTLVRRLDDSGDEKRLRISTEGDR